MASWTAGASKFTDPAVQLSVSQVGERLIRSCRMDVGEADCKPKFSDRDVPSKCLQIPQYLAFVVRLICALR